MVNMLTLSAIGGAITGGVSYISSTRAINKQMKIVNKIAAENNGKVPTGGMTKDGALWDGFTTPQEIKKQSNKIRLISTAFSAALGMGTTAILNYAIKFLSSLKK